MYDTHTIILPAKLKIKSLTIPTGHGKGFVLLIGDVDIYNTTHMYPETKATTIKFVDHGRIRSIAISGIRVTRFKTIKNSGKTLVWKVGDGVLDLPITCTNVVETKIEFETTSVDFWPLLVQYNSPKHCDLISGSFCVRPLSAEDPPITSHPIRSTSRHCKTARSF